MRNTMVMMIRGHQLRIVIDDESEVDYPGIRVFCGDESPIESVAVEAYPTGELKVHVWPPDQDEPITTDFTPPKENSNAASE